MIACTVIKKTSEPIGAYCSFFLSRNIHFIETSVNGFSVGSNKRNVRKNVKFLILPAVFVLNINSRVLMTEAINARSTAQQKEPTDKTSEMGGLFQCIRNQ